MSKDKNNGAGLGKLFNRVFREKTVRTSDAAEEDTSAAEESVEESPCPETDNFHMPESRYAPDMIFSAGHIWQTVAQEYCIANDKTMDTLGVYDKRKIFEYACTPVSYLFLWAARRGYLSPRLTSRLNIASVLIDNANPARFLVDKMDSMICMGDFSEEIHGFITEYYLVSTPSDDEGRKFEYDYYIQIRNPWKIFYCIDFSADFYDRLEEKIDAAFRFCKSKEQWMASFLHESTGYEELKMSETFGHRLEVVKSPGVSPAYADKCTAQVCNMSVGLQDKLCDSLIKFAGICGNKTEKYMIDKSCILSELYSGRLIIPEPYGDEPAYVLIFESDFETEHGTGIVIRDGDVVNVSYAEDTQSPWMYVNDMRYRIMQSLKLTDAAEVDSLGKALREYSEGTLEQGIIIPYFTGSKVPEENRLFVPEPVASLKSRNDIIAEKLLTEGKADSYECIPDYREGSFIPSDLSVTLYLRNVKVFNSEVSVW